MTAPLPPSPANTELKNTPIPKGFILSHPAHLLSLGFGTGLSRFAPGTIGTLIGFPLFLILSPLPPLLQGVVLAGLFIAGCFLCDYTGKALGVSDHGGIVWDEIIAYAIVLKTVPFQWQWWLGAFVAFRLFDILKPWPIRWFDQRLKNGFGVMFDDLLAALYAIITLYLCKLLP